MHMNSVIPIILAQILVQIIEIYMEKQGQEGQCDLPDQARLTTTQGNQSAFSKMKQSLSSFLYNTFSRFFPVSPSNLLFGKDKTKDLPKPETTELPPRKPTIIQQPLVMKVSQPQKSMKRVKFLDADQIEQLKEAEGEPRLRKKVKHDGETCSSNQALTRMSYANYLEYKSTELQFQICEKLLVEHRQSQQEQEEVARKTKHLEKKRKISKQEFALREEQNRKRLRERSKKKNISEETIEPYPLTKSKEEALDFWKELVQNFNIKKKQGEREQQEKRTKELEKSIESHQEDKTFIEDKQEVPHHLPVLAKEQPLPKTQIVHLSEKIEKKEDREIFQSKQEIPLSSNKSISSNIFPTLTAETIDKEKFSTPLKNTSTQYPATPSNTSLPTQSPATVQAKQGVSPSPSPSKPANPFIRQTATPPINLQALIGNKSFPIFNQAAPGVSPISSLMVPNTSPTANHIFSNLNTPKPNLFTNSTTFSQQTYHKIEEEPAHLHVPALPQNPPFVSPPVLNNYAQNMNAVPVQTYFPTLQQPKQQAPFFAPSAPAPPTLPQFSFSAPSRQAIEFNCFLQPQPTAHQSLFSQERPQRHNSQASKGKKTQRIM